MNLKRVVLCQDGDDLVVGSSTGRLLRLEVNEENLPVMGRNAQGPVLLRLLPGEEVIGAAAVSDGVELVLGSQKGTLVMINPTLALRKCERGSLGQICIRFQNKSDTVIDFCVTRRNQLLSVVCRGSNNQRINTSSLEATSDHSPAGKENVLHATDEIQEIFTTHMTNT